MIPSPVPSILTEDRLFSGKILPARFWTEMPDRKERWTVLKTRELRQDETPQLSVTAWYRVMVIRITLYHRRPLWEVRPVCLWRNASLDKKKDS